MMIQFMNNILVFQVLGISNMSLFMPKLCRNCSEKKYRRFYYEDLAREILSKNFYFEMDKAGGP